MRVRHYDPAAAPGQQAGAVYFLPKSRLQVAFDIKLDATIDDQKCEANVSDCKYQLTARQIELSNVALGTQQLPDPKAGFVIETNGTFVVETEFTGAFTPQGELTSLNAVVRDQGLAFAAEGISSLAKIASVMAMAGRTTASTIQAQSRRRRTLVILLNRNDAALAAMQLCGQPREVTPVPLSTPLPSSTTDSEPKGKTFDSKPSFKSGTSTFSSSSSSSTLLLASRSPRCAPADEIKKALELRSSLVAEIRALDEELNMERTVRINCSFDPTDRTGTVEIKDDGAICPPYGALKFQLEQSGFDVPLPTLKVHWSSVNGGERGGGAAAPTPSREPDTYAGIVYRIPEWFVVTVSKGDAALAGNVIALPQFGKIFTTSFDDMDLRAGKQLKVELHEGQGSLKLLSVKATPVNPEQIQRIVDASLNAARTLTPTQAQPMDETTRFLYETKRIEAEKAYIHALQDLTDLKNPPAPAASSSSSSSSTPKPVIRNNPSTTGSTEGRPSPGTVIRPGGDVHPGSPR